MNITQITRVDGVAQSVKFSNDRKIWIASERETAMILKALK